MEGGAVDIQIDPHTLERTEERGTSAQKIEDVIETADVFCEKREEEDTNSL